jgi:serine/threonine-protein kinase HSL1 (negative regulator of Swe1 kinase)
VKVVDFGIFGSNMGSVAEKSNCGSLKFMAPELLQGRTESTPKIDVWSLGCILHALILGYYPFTDSDKEKLKKLIVKQEICVSRIKQQVQSASSDSLDLIDKMLIKDPKQRISLLDVFRHPWICTQNNN